MREIKHLVLQQPLLIVYIRDFLILISNYGEMWGGGGGGGGVGVC